MPGGSRSISSSADEFRPAIPRSGCSPALPVSASPARPDYHAPSPRPAKTGHFYFAGNRTFLLCVDTGMAPWRRLPSRDSVTEGWDRPSFLVVCRALARQQQPDKRQKATVCRAGSALASVEPAWAEPRGPPQLLRRTERRNKYLGADRRHSQPDPGGLRRRAFLQLERAFVSRRQLVSAGALCWLRVEPGRPLVTD